MHRLCPGRAVVAAASLLTLDCGALPRPEAASLSSRSAPSAAPPAASALPPSPSSPTGKRALITMSEQTVSSLAASAFSLYAFKAIASDDGSGVPLVWLQSRSYSLSTLVSWELLYQAYTSTQTALPSATVDASASYDILAGQVLQVQQASGIGTVRIGGSPGLMSIENQTSTQFRCGLSQRSGASSARIASFALYGNALQVFAPVEKVLFLFAASSLRPGDPVVTSPGPGVLVDFTQVSARSLVFDINTGWSWGGQTWATAIAAGSPVAPLLIVKLPATIAAPSAAAGGS